MESPRRGGAGEYADEDRRQLDEHRGGAGVDSLFAGIERDAVDREPGDSDQRGERPLPGVIRTSLRPIIMALRARLATSSRPRLRAPADVVSRIPDHDEG